MKLKSKTVFITGASRGIGLAMARRFAADGANVVIAAKSDTAHKFLPGTIHETADAVRDAGGHALALKLDVRSDEAIGAAIEAAVREFGGIDVLVHNAGAYWLKPTVEFSVKRHDLVFDINERAYFLLARAAHPYLCRSDNPHILGLAPPIDLNPVWFMNSSAYTVSKYAMSLYTLGWAAEWKDDGIAVNTLWPRCGIYSPSAVIHGGEDLVKEFRKPEIMADAAYGIVTRPSREFTGNHCIDDSFLYDNGVTDLDQYAMQPGHPLVPDYMVPLDSPPPPGVALTKNRLYDFTTGELLPGAQVGMAGKD
ncbi:MAG: SDR family oxidoreductase [Gammaproteobacteria bacterium]|nr:SDR family oxidoreductase [Gammaproteobacteria bacterium]MDH3371902.1 SDR family oxidoreductase [Gammaproteobacteria bacterium]MDH3407769.1 SDR family oxidoreductase [Gammaproteobacteria bacterium]MDH3551112.1 SDR family oxidoreductase [Gammaproteobacteria bacterium]